MKLERTCSCFEDLTILPDENSIINKTLNFQKGHEYQVDILADNYKVYVNGGWYGYVHLNNEDFEKHFKLID